MKAERKGWTDYLLQHDVADMSRLLENVVFPSPRFVLKKGTPDAWDDFSLHDPVVLTDERGMLVRGRNNEMYMYYSGFSNDRDGQVQGLGRAVSDDNGISWRKDPADAVLAPRPGAWDARVSSTGWAFRDGSLYRMYYRGARKSYRDAIGYAESPDGIRFRRDLTGPILTADMFTDIVTVPRRMMGAVNVVRTLDERYLLTFEAFSKSCDSKTQIFGAFSDNGIDFIPCNEGRPFFSCRDVRSWPVTKVANPRITVLEETNSYIMMFNGAHDDGYYSLGMVYSDDLVTWTENRRNPLLVPCGYPLEHPYSGRLEAGVWVKDDIRQQKDSLRFYHIAIPIKGPSNYNSEICLNTGVKAKTSVPRVHIARGNEADVTVGEDEVELRCEARSPFASSIYANSSAGGVLHPKGVRFEVLAGPETDMYIHCADRFSYLSTLSGIKLRIYKNRVRIFRTRLTNLVRKVYQALYQRYPRLMVRANTLFGWHNIMKIDRDTWVPVEITTSDSGVTCCVGGRNKTITRHVDSPVLDFLSVHCLAGRMKIRKLAFRKAV